MVIANSLAAESRFIQVISLARIGGGRGFDGVIDDVRIYNQVLSEATIERLAQGQSEVFDYDTLGNRTQVALKTGAVETYAVDALTNQYDAVGSYDVQLGYDAAGNVVTDEEGYSYVWDYENRLKRVYIDLDSDGVYDEGSDTDVVAYDYDALGRRIEMRVPGEVVDTVTRYYFNDRWQVVMETDEEGATRREFVYGNGIDEPLILIDGMTAGEPLYYYVQDHLNSTVVLLDEAADVAERYEYDVYGKPSVWVAAGSVSDSIMAPTVRPMDSLTFYADAAAGWLEQPLFTTRDMKVMEETSGEMAVGDNTPILLLAALDPNEAWSGSDMMGWPSDPNSTGLIAADTGIPGGLEMLAMSVAGPTSELTASAVGSVVGNPYSFTGRRLDILDGGAKLIQINRHRYYDYRTGRWLSVDPAGYVDGMNLYQYAYSQVMINTDPMGKMTNVIDSATDYVDPDTGLIYPKVIYPDAQTRAEPPLYGPLTESASLVYEKLAKVCRNKKCRDNSDCKCDLFKCLREARQIANDYIKMWDNMANYPQSFAMINFGIQDNSYLGSEYGNLHCGWPCFYWQTLTYNAIKASRDSDSCFKVWRAGYDPTETINKSMTIRHNWATVSVGERPLLTGPCSVRLDPWEKSAPFAWTNEEHRYSCNIYYDESKHEIVKRCVSPDGKIISPLRYPYEAFPWLVVEINK